MMQRTVGMYIANKIKDEFLNPQDPEQEEVEAVEVQETADALDGQSIANADGQVLGVARRVRNVPVYVVGRNGSNVNTELDRALNDPDAEIIVHREGRTVTAIVYVPSANATLPTGPTHGFRSDEV